MTLREELLPPAVDPEQVRELTQIGKQIVRAMDSGQNTAALIGRFNALTGGNYDPAEFDYVAGSMDMEEFAEQVLTPQPLRIEDIADEELLELIRRVQSNDVTEPERAYWREREYWLELLRINIPNPHISDLINAAPQATADEILIQARKWKPILL